ncbi:hypothetical protein A4W93_01450 [Piscinibacter gummiphilus]|uniref:Uncharacterized protein n=1 Tax=Piscinibacter gummiphilus TaxID=946333 RepID=A0A1W6L340_9BURK|nr:hypothetical protein A4W93_01450 [Piscinibacter gummiphilus]ATU63323.1 hypothetical protein CPZ87_01485 [Piscinibacter gummiphilus]GLS95662.1 hypothetical protein GCM10007918_29540 [Piscinibacter gummiphilus]
MEVAARLPWLIATCRIVDDGDSFLQTTLTGWGPHLRDCFQPIADERVVSVQVMVPAEHGDGWDSHDVESFWSASVPDMNVRTVLAQVRPGKFFDGLNWHDTADGFKQRVLLMRI